MMARAIRINAGKKRSELPCILVLRICTLSLNLLNFSFPVEWPEPREKICYVGFDNYGASVHQWI